MKPDSKLSEEHKQRIRDGIARRKAEAEAAKQELPAAEVTGPGVVIDHAGVPTAHVSIPTPPSNGPAALFAEWIRTPEGLDATDPRVPQDRVRFAIYLEDVLRKAFVAGYNAYLV